MKFNFFSCNFEGENYQPDKMAVIGSDSSLSWCELKQKTDFFANCILQANIPFGSPIIIYGHKQVGILPAILACFITKRPYVPIDPAIPLDRIKKIMLASSAQACFYFEKNNAIDGLFKTMIDLNGIAFSTSISAPSNIHFNMADPLAYIIFTSGSTGEPKGVQITHESLQSFCEWILCDYNFDENISLINRVPFIFDVSVFDYCSPLLFGGTLVLTDNETAANADQFFNNIKKNNCNTWVSTPGFAYQYLRHPEFNKIFLPTLHTFYFAGEVLMPNVVAQLWKLFPGCKVVNAYGPTEATVYATKIEITPEIIAESASLPIGYPKLGSNILIQKDVSATNNEGEIVIIGNHVSVGYCNNFELNAEKFTTINGERAFKTGDYGYYKNNLIFFLGRRDEQVKLHGYRIELDEITASLLRFEKIAEAVTIPLRRGGEVKKIISFIIPKTTVSDNHACVIEESFKNLRQELPAYMIPGEILVLTTFPVSSSHKVDKKKLLEMYLENQL
jgi:D-alanine--poly(phosphoribitol) ligase subunit 1